MLGVILRAHGAVVRAMASTEEAWAALDSGVALPDILLSDVGMPDADGYDLIRRLRKSVVPALFDLPAIAVTGYANPDDRSRALAAGYHAHIPKPIEPTRLVTWIAGLVVQPASARNPRQKDVLDVGLSDKDGRIVSSMRAFA